MRGSAAVSNAIMHDESRKRSRNKHHKAKQQEEEQDEEIVGSDSVVSP
jgi:hypothetical protein